VCGSHTAGATRQLERLSDIAGPPIVVDTQAALAEPGAVVAATAARVREQLRRPGVAVVATERQRRSDHDTLAHGERVMQVLAGIVREVHRDVDLLISKGGITAAEVAATGMGATSAHVRGQLEPGVSVWELRDRAGRGVPQVIVPGNVGGPDVIASCLLRARGGSLLPHPAG